MTLPFLKYRQSRVGAIDISQSSKDKTGHNAGGSGTGANTNTDTRSPGDRLMDVQATGGSGSDYLPGPGSSNTMKMVIGVVVVGLLIYAISD